jgi:hypothetical protein
MDYSSGIRITTIDVDTAVFHSPSRDFQYSHAAFDGEV